MTNETALRNQMVSNLVQKEGGDPWGEGEWQVARSYTCHDAAAALEAKGASRRPLEAVCECIYF